MSERNPIIDVLASYLGQGKQITRVGVSGPNRRKPTHLVVAMGEKTEQHPISFAGEEEFMAAWKQAGAWVSFHWDDLA